MDIQFLGQRSDCADRGPAPESPLTCPRHPFMDAAPPPKGAGDDGQLGAWLLGCHEAPLKENRAAGDEQRPLGGQGLVHTLGYS